MNDKSPAKVLMVTCPKCKKKFNYYDSPYRPFCSERCKEVDLGNWFSESYSVPSEEPLELEEIDALERAMEEKLKNGEQ